MILAKLKTLTNGGYKLMIEPIMYITYNGVKTAMTANEAALYNQLGGEEHTPDNPITVTFHIRCGQRFSVQIEVKKCSSSVERDIQFSVMG